MTLSKFSYQKSNLSMKSFKVDRTTFDTKLPIDLKITIEYI